jgi:hypothetical protein
MQRSTVVLALVAGALVLLIAGAALVAALSGNEERFADGTPQRAVQQYLHAIDDNDASAAFEFLAPALVERCGSLPRDIVTRRGDSALRATLDRVVNREGTATVYVELSETYEAAPFGISDPEQSLVFELAQVDGAWRFSEMPWPLYCIGLPQASGPPSDADG